MARSLIQIDLHNLGQIGYQPGRPYRSCSISGLRNGSGESGVVRLHARDFDRGRSQGGDRSNGAATYILFVAHLRRGKCGIRLDFGRNGPSSRRTDLCPGQDQARTADHVTGP